MSLKFEMYFLLLALVIVWGTNGNEDGPTIFDFDSQERHLEVGRNQYKILSDRGTLPVYGTCWKRALSNLNVGCKNLNEQIQSDVALRFTDCFLVTSGHKPYACETKADLKNDCLTHMSDRAFNAYTEFYTHTQDICFYLQSQIWREETEKSIHKLSKTSSQVTEQLEHAKEHAEEMQAVLLEHQKESMSIQMELLGNGESLNEILVRSQNSVNDIMSEFRMATMEQKKLLFDVFERLSSLQTWAIGEISWLDSVVFYFVSSIISYVITATPRTQGARLWIFIIISLNVLIERTVCSYLLQDNYSEINAFNDNLYWWIWFCRKVLLGICVVVLGCCIYTYRDYNVVNHELLIEIQKQNSQLLDQMKSFDGSFSLSSVQKLTHSYGHDNTATIIGNGIFCSTPLREKTPIGLTITSLDEPDYSPVKSSSLKSPSPTPSRSSKTSVMSVGAKIVRKDTSSRKHIVEISPVVGRYSLRSRSKIQNLSEEI